MTAPVAETLSLNDFTRVAKCARSDRAADAVNDTAANNRPVGPKTGAATEQ